MTIYDNCTALASVRFMGSNHETIHKIKEMIGQFESNAGTKRVQNIATLEDIITNCQKVENKKYVRSVRLDR